MQRFTESISANKRIAKNSVFMSIRMVLVLCITLYSTRIVLEVLGVEDYGIFSLIAGFVSLFSFLSTSMSNSIQRFYNFEYGRGGVDAAKKVFATSIFIQLLLALILFILLEAFGIWYIKNKMVIPYERLTTAISLYHLTIISFVCIIFQAPFIAAVMAHENMGFYSTMSVADAMMKLAIVIFLPYLGGDSLLRYGLLLVCVSVVMLCSYVCFCKRRYPEIQFCICFDKVQLKSMLSFSGWNLLGSFSGVMKEQGVNMVMNLFYGPIVNAAKGIASQVNNGLQSFVSNIIVPVRPQIIQSYSQGNIDRVINLTFSVSKFTSYILYAFSLPIIFEISYILQLWLGSNVPQYSAQFVVIVVLTSFVSNLNGSISGVVHASGKMKRYQIVGSIVNLIAVPIVYVSLSMGASPQVALILVGIVTLLNQVVCMIILKSIVRYSLREYLKIIIYPFAIVVVSTFWIPMLIVNMIEPGFVRLCLTVVISILSVSGAIYLLGTTKSEKALVKNLVTSRLK